MYQSVTAVNCLLKFLDGATEVARIYLDSLSAAAQHVEITFPTPIAFSTNTIFNYTNNAGSVTAHWSISGFEQ